MTTPVKLPAADGVNVALAWPAASVVLPALPGANGAPAVHWMFAALTGAVLSPVVARAVAPIDLLPEAVEAVGGQTSIIVDGGIRRGTDILKALALGADACSIGRAYLYGLGAGGEAGVRRAFQLLEGELRVAMTLAGVRSVKEIDASVVRRLRGA